MLNLLQELASGNPAAFAALAAIASAMTAMAAVIISPLITYSTVRKQIRANLVSGNRQAWINALRDELAEAFELLTWQFLLRPGTHSGEEGYKYVSERRARIRLLIYRIRLRLNAQEQESHALLDLLGKLESLALTSNGHGGPEFEEKMEEAVATAQKILKLEWNRVKKGR